MAVDYLSALNVGSGLNVTQIVDSLVDAERVPKQTKIEAALEEATVSISALGTLKQELNLFNTNAKALDGQVGLNLSSSSSNVVLTRTENNTASEFSHAIEVQQIATAQVINFPNFTSMSTDTGVAKLTIEFGNWDTTPAFTSHATLGMSTLSAGLGLEAQILEVSTGSYSLMVKSIAGADTELRIRSYGGSPEAETDDLKFNPAVSIPVDSGTAVVDGANAAFTIDGISIQRDTNTITDLFAGVQIDLLGTTSSSQSISSNYSQTAALETLTTVVSEINYLVNFLKEQTQPGSDGAEKGALHGDYFVKSLETKIKTLTTTAIPGFDDEDIFMSNFGVMTERDGSLSIDEDRFKAYFAQYPEHLAAVTTSMVRAADPAVTGSTTTDLYTAGVYDFELDTTNGARIDDGSDDNNPADPTDPSNQGDLTAMISGTVSATGTTRHTITTEGKGARGVILETARSTVSTQIYMGRSLLQQLSGYVEEVLRFNGQIDTQIQTIKDDVKTYDEDLEKLEDQMVRQRKLYVEKFTAMESAVTSFKETGKFLDNFIQSWQSNN